jgi:hypothetical protein
MRTGLAVVVALATFVLGACGGGETTDTGVASIDAVGGAGPVDSASDVATGADEEAALLAFTRCMRDNGVDIGDPSVDAEGNASLDFSGIDLGSLDEESVAAAQTACSEQLEGATLGFDLGDPTELEDMALEFARCMRANGYDLDDPDFSGLGNSRGQAGGPGGNPFGDVDFSDPAFQSALDSCRDVLAGFGTAAVSDS